MKLIDAKKDQYRKLAHEQGYRSRASYKLKEINKSYRIIGPGSYVLDLGCAPGGWTQVAKKISGNQGKVLGIDLSFVEEIPNAKIIKADIENIDVIDEINSYFGKKVDWFFSLCEARLGLSHYILVLSNFIQKIQKIFWFS